MSLLQDVQQLAIKKKVPALRPGLTVKVHQRIQEGGKTRTQIFQGIIIRINSGYGADKTFTVRKVVEGIGVEKTFPVYSTNIEKIVPVKSAKVRRAKLYYLRTRFGKSARMKEALMGVSDEEIKELEIKKEEAILEAKEEPKEGQKEEPKAEVKEKKEEEQKDEIKEEK